MKGINWLPREVPVPQSKISRSLGLGQMVAGIFGNVIFQGSKDILKGRSPDLGNLLLTEKNTLKFVSQLSKMRGAALKVGQLISLDNGDFLPKNIAVLLSSLRNEAFFVPPYQLGQILRKAYGDNFLNKFCYFDEKPIAAASIGQVHKCVSKDGKKLILKIQYPGIKKSIDSDIRNLSLIFKASRRLFTPPNNNKIFFYFL